MDLKSLAKVILVIILIGLLVWFARIVSGSEYLQELISDLGYFGVFIIALVAGFNVIVPVPAVSFLPTFIAAGLSKFWVVVVIALGATLADSIAYLLGRAGRELVPSKRDKKIADFFKEISEKGGKWAIPIILILFASFAPLPNEVLVIPLAFLGYRFRFIFPIVFVGNVIFNSLVASGISFFDII